MDGGVDDLTYFRIKLLWSGAGRKQKGKEGKTGKKLKFLPVLPSLPLLLTPRLSPGDLTLNVTTSDGNDTA